MAWLDSLLPFLIFVIYVLAQLRKRGAKRTPTAEASVDVEPSRKRTTFQEIIRQIQEAAAEAQTGQQEEVIMDPEAAWLHAPPPLLPPLTPSSDAMAFRAQGGFEHERHGFGAENPFSEESFERQAPSPPPPPHKPGHLDYNPHGRLAEDGQPRGRAGYRHNIVARLRTADGLRDAFVMKEILDRPRSSRRS